MAASLSIGVLALYLVTLTHVHTFDALSYVTSVERKPWTELFHPHHLAYGPLGALALASARALGYAGGAELPLQLVNAVAGALGVLLLFRSVRRISGRTDAALAAALLLAGGYAYWYYAVEVEVYTLAALFLIICMDLICRPGPWTRRRLLALGLAHAGATLFHQTNLLLAAPILVCAALDLTDRKPRTEGRTSLPAAINQGASAATKQAGRPWYTVLGAWFGAWRWYGVTYGLAVGLPYLAVMLGVSGFRTPDAALAWLTEYARTGWWGGPLTGDKIAKLGQGLADTLAQPGGGWVWLALGLCALPWPLRRPAGSRAGSIPPAGRAALVTWLALYGAFFTWWEPDNVEFWIAILPPLLLLLALRLASSPPWRARPLAALGVAVALGAANYSAIERRGDAATDLQRVVARELAARSTPADLLVVPDGLLELYLPHYQQRENFISLNQALFDAGDDAGAACDTVRGRIELALHAGASALIAEEALHPPDALLARHHLSRAAAEACLAPYQDDLVPLVLPAPVPAYARLLRADERAAGQGWSFGRSTQGWSAANISDARFDGGWSFRAGADPGLTSPLLSLDTAAYDAIELRLASTATARDAQLFFAGPDGRIDEARSLRWQLAANHAPTTYRIELRGAPGWAGTITRLRLDPVSAGQGSELRVEWIRLIRAVR